MHEKFIIYRRKLTSDVSYVNLRQKRIINTHFAAEIMLLKINHTQLLGNRINPHGIVYIY